MKVYYVYIVASKRNGPIYIGVTNDVERRNYEHKMEILEGFTKKYGVKMLVHFEEYQDVRIALQREKNLKHWNREWKVALIEKDNPHWQDLAPLFLDPWVKPEDDKVELVV